MAGRILLEISLTSQGLSGSQALQVRNAIEDQVDDSGVGEVVGAGCAVDGSSCHLDIETEDFDAAESFLRDLLDHVGLWQDCVLHRE